MRKSRLEARTSAEANAEAGNRSDPNEGIFKDGTALDTNDEEDFFDDLGFLNDESLEMIVTEMIYEWRGNDIRNSLEFPAASHM